MEGKATKRQKTGLRKDQGSKVAELEEFLFGSKAAASQLFERPATSDADGDDTPLSISDLIHRAEHDGSKSDAPLFFEDRAGRTQRKSAPATQDDSTDSDDDAPEEAPSKYAASQAAIGTSKRKQPKLSQRRAVLTTAAAQVKKDLSKPRTVAGFGSDSEEQESADEEAMQAAESSDDDDGLSSSVTEEDEQPEHKEVGDRAPSAAGGADGGRPGTAKSSARANSKEAAAMGTGPVARGGVASSSGRSAVWSDPADQVLQVDVARNSRLRKLRTSEKQTVMDGAQYESALRKQHKILNPRTTWASANRKEAAAAARKAGAASGYGSDSSDNDAEGEVGVSEAQQLLRTAGGLVGPRSTRLPAGNIEATRLKDANVHEPSAGVVQSVRFHPNAQLLLTAGLDKKLRLFHIDGLRNPKVQAVHFDDMPIHNAEFAGAGGSKILLSGRRPHCYIYDLAANKIERLPGPMGRGLKSLESFAVSPAGGAGEPLAAFAGDQGYVPLLSLRTRQWVGELKMSGSARSMAFSPDGTQLLTSGGDGVVCTWDLRMRRCLHSMLDSGNAGSGGGSALALSPDSRFIATGSDSGVVNVYRHSQVAKAPRSIGHISIPPIKEIMNLTTSVDTLTFSPDAQILAIASRMSKDALRLVHLPSLTVFANWPTTRSPLHYVHSLDFSPGGGFLAIGNAKGRVLLYRLHHYSQA